MGRTGNGTNSAQWLYVKLHIPFIWKTKIGITGYLFQRTRQTSAKVWGFYVPVAFIQMYFAWPVEQFILNATKGLRRQVLGKGGKEIRPWYIGLVVALCIYILGVLKWTLPVWVTLTVGRLAGW